MLQPKQRRMFNRALRLALLSFKHRSNRYSNKFFNSDRRICDNNYSGTTQIKDVQIYSYFLTPLVSDWTFVKDLYGIRELSLRRRARKCDRYTNYTEEITVGEEEKGEDERIDLHETVGAISALFFGYLFSPRAVILPTFCLPFRILGPPEYSRNRKRTTGTGCAIDSGCEKREGGRPWPKCKFSCTRTSDVKS